MSKPGRPRALDDVKQREVIALISAGCGIETAARYVGCAPRTIYRETRRNPEFHERFRKAELASTLSPLQTIQRAAHENWRAATWLLERKLPQNFAPTHRDMIDPDDLGQIFDRFFDEIGHAIPDEDTRDRVLKRIDCATRNAVYNVTTNRKNPKTRRQKSSQPNLPRDTRPPQPAWLTNSLPTTPPQ